jgi:hypothetical protein
MVLDAAGDPLARRRLGWPEQLRSVDVALRRWTKAVMVDTHETAPMVRVRRGTRRVSMCRPYIDVASLGLQLEALCRSRETLSVQPILHRGSRTRLSKVVLASVAAAGQR